MSALVKTATVNLDRPRTLKFNFNTVRLFEKETGKNFFAAGNGFSGTETLVILWACLKTAGEDITLEQVGEMVDFGNVNEIGAAVQELVGASMPETKKQDTGAPLAQKPQI